MNFVPELKARLKKQILNPKAFLGRLKFPDENARDSACYVDSNYLPFYHYFGELIQPSNVIELGLDIGLVSGTFLTACKSVEHFLAFQPKGKDYYSPRLARGNIWNTLRRKFMLHYGDIHEDEFIKKVLHFKWDCVLINEEQEYRWYMDVIDLLWNQLNFGAVLVFDHVKSHKPMQTAYGDICKSKNREPIIIQTRFGTGLLER